MSTLLSLCCLRQWAAGGGGDVHTEKDSQLPRNKVAETLLEDVCIRQTCGYVKSRVAITLVRATHRCIRGSRVPAHEISVQSLQWEEGARINQFSYPR